MSLNNIKASNFILGCDSYKFHHFAEYPADTEYIYSTVVPRKGTKYTNEIVAAGASFTAAYLASVGITREMIDEAEVEIKAMGYEFNRKDWEIIVDEFGGKLPLAIYGVPEGQVVKPNTPILGIVNTDKRFFWLVSYVETVVQRIMWKMTTVASVSRYIYKLLMNAAIVTGADKSMVEYRLHNFGDRGADGEDAAIMSAIAHGMLFSGSDCASANRYIKTIYNTQRSYLSSVDATEHSVMCSHSDAETKDDYGAAVMAVERLEEAVRRAKRGVGIPLQSVVIDTYDDERFVKEYLGERLAARIIKSGGTLVARPDSGDAETKPIEVIGWLEDKFGLAGHTDTGFAILHPAVRAIQGDGITVYSIPEILENLIASRYSLDNLVLGMGGGLTHGGGRDEFSFSMKATARFNGYEWVNLLKEPKTDAGKKSLTGLAHAQYFHEDGEMFTSNDQYNVFSEANGWFLFFHNGDITRTENYDEVRKRARK